MKDMAFEVFKAQYAARKESERKAQRAAQARARMEEPAITRG